MLLAVVMMTLSMPMRAFAQETEPAEKRQKFAFTIAGPERYYNQIRVVNHTSEPYFQCRVVYLTDDDEIEGTYGVYDLNGYEDSDSNTQDIRRGTRIGVQLPKEFTNEVRFSVEYKDYPFYDAIFIHIHDRAKGFDDSF